MIHVFLMVQAKKRLQASKTKNLYYFQKLNVENLAAGCHREKVAGVTGLVPSVGSAEALPVVRPPPPWKPAICLLVPDGEETCKGPQAVHNGRVHSLTGTKKKGEFQKSLHSII